MGFLLFLPLMNFLFPTFLIGLVAISIPIIIHLFNFRRYKKVYFTNVQFLKELKQESDHKSRLKELLILICRILAITCLVFAFAQPYIPGKQTHNKGNKAVSIYIDNSFSMESINSKGTLLENAKQYANDIVLSLNNDDKIQLITNDFEGKHQRFLSKEEFIEQIQEIKISAATKPLSAVIKRQSDFLQNSSIKQKRIFILSDFQKNQAVFSKENKDTSIQVSLIPITANEVNNVYIDSVWFESPVQQYGTQQTLHALIVNNSTKDIENGSIKLHINNAQVSLASYNISAGNKKEVSLSFTIKNNGINNGELIIEDYPITYDDRFYFSFNAQSIIHTLIVNGKDSQTAQNFRALMQQDSLFKYYENSENAIDYSLFKSCNLIILNELFTFSSGLISELQKFVTTGGSLIIFPSQKINLEDYQLALRSLQLPSIVKLDTSRVKTQSINFEQGLYEGVFDKIDVNMDMPKVMAHYIFLNHTKNTTQNLMMLQNRDPLILYQTLGSGKLYLFAIPSSTEGSNFIKHALFVPSILKMAIMSLKPSPIYYTTATNTDIELNYVNTNPEQPLHIVSNDKKIDIIPEHRVSNNSTILYTQNQINQAGFYTISQLALNIKNIAFNFNRNESDMQFESNEQLQKQLDELGLNTFQIISPSEKSLTKVLQEINDDKKLWKLCLILTLVFLLSEILIIRLFKN